MTYFSQLPTINYDFNVGSNNEIRKVRDISANIRFQKHMLDDITLFDVYDIKDGETPESISQKFYGTPLYHWILMLLNDRYDILNDWPLSTAQFERYMADKYGVGNYRQIHHYVNATNKPVTDTDIYIDPYMVDHKIVCNISYQSNIVTAIEPNAFEEAITDNKLMVVKSLGIPTDMGPVYVDHFLDKQTAVLTADALTNQTVEITFVHMVDPLDGATPVTNLEYETYVNEAKRRIKILHPQTLQSIIQQFGTIING